VTIDHYENFPVASLLCPPALRPAVAAIYHFARTADDIADEGDTAANERRALLQRYEQALTDAAGGRVASDWPEVFGPLTQQIARHDLPVALLRDLLLAFRQDTYNAPYPDRAALLDYCGRSANPVGRLLLHLIGVCERDALAQSDSICSALQLVNFWQDLSVDLRRGRCYLPLADARRHGLELTALDHDSDASRALVRELCSWSRQLMRQGEPLIHLVRGRFGWELRLVVQGGLRVLDKIEAHRFNALNHRPAVGASDMPVMFWRALWMKRGKASPLISDRAAP
jgi:squalene synthase HpnC